MFGAGPALSGELTCSLAISYYPCTRPACVLSIPTRLGDASTLRALLDCQLEQGNDSGPIRWFCRSSIRLNLGAQQPNTNIL